MKQINLLKNINKALCIVLLLVVFITINNSGIVHAQTTEIEDEVSTRGIYTKLSLSFNSSNGIISATVRNEFTLGYSTIVVIVEIYSSYEIFDSIEDMTLESRNTIADLNIYESISTSCPVGGEQKYWCAVMKYKQDSKDWVTQTTSLILLDKNGNKV